MPPVQSSERVGTRIAGKYEILRPVAEGGMGSVFEATHLQLRRRVALKLMRPEFLSDPDAVERFLREARAAAAVNHPSIVEIFDYGRAEDGTPYIAMAYLEGESLAERLYRAGRLDETTAVLTLLPVVSALSKVHARGIVHRDLKPENVLITRDHEGSERAVLLDFGVAKFESDPDDAAGHRGGTVLGTPAYMSPEQAAGRAHVDARSDIYALGATFYELVSGATPYQKGTYDETIAAIQAGPPRALGRIVPTVSAAMEATVACAMARDPSARFETMEEFGHALEEVLAAPMQGGLTLRARPAAQAAFAERASRGNEADHGAEMVEVSVHTVMMDAPIAPMLLGLPESPGGAAASLSSAPLMGLPPLPTFSGPSPLTLPSPAPTGIRPALSRSFAPPPPSPDRDRLALIAGALMGLVGIALVAFALVHTTHRAARPVGVDAGAMVPTAHSAVPTVDSGGPVVDASAATDGAADAASSPDAATVANPPSDAVQPAPPAGHNGHGVGRHGGRGAHGGGHEPHGAHHHHHH